MKIKKLTICFLSFIIFSVQIFSQKTAPDLNNQAELEMILQKCADYCEKLNGAVLDFVCLEKIREEIYQHYKLQKVAESNRGVISVRRFPTPEIYNYLYDYQLIRKDNRIKEKRILLKENEEKKYEEDAPLKTKRFNHANVILGPIGLLSKSRQQYYNYEIIDRMKRRGTNVTVIEAVPKSNVKTDTLYGRIWVTDDDFSIVKTEWEQESIEDLDLAEKDAKRFKQTPPVMKPVIKSYSEYHFEKNGIRFPSRYTLVETYYAGKKRYGTRTRMYVTYKDYKFFTVETDHKIIKAQPTN